VADQPCVIFWLPGMVNSSFHDVHADGLVFVTVMFTDMPVDQVEARQTTLQ
jgi:hypothetical protein